MEIYNREKLNEHKEELLILLSKMKRNINPILLCEYIDFINGEISLYDVYDTNLLIQMLSKYDILNINVYKSFVQALKKYDLLRGNVLEVAAGEYPLTSELTAPIIKEAGGTLTIIEPDCKIDELQDVTIIKDKFSKKTNIDAYETIYSQLPCEATIDVVEKALQEDKNLFVTLCSCNHSNKRYPKVRYKYWAQDFCEALKDKYKDEIMLTIEPYISTPEHPAILRLRDDKKQMLK